MTSLSKEWPANQDAMSAASAYHQVLLENEQVRVLDVRIAAGATVPLHTHRWPAVMYVLTFSDFIRYDADGQVVVDTRKLDVKPKIGEALWSPPLALHSVKNVGETELRVISVEVKDSGDSGF